MIKQERRQKKHEAARRKEELASNRKAIFQLEQAISGRTRKKKKPRRAKTSNLVLPNV